MKRVISTHICIVGGGPAGITLAKELIGQKFQVIILESGKDNPYEETLSLRDGASDNDPQFYPFHQRQRQLVGTANKWGVEISQDKIGVRYAPFEPFDFKKQSWLPYSGWPISRADLDPFYQRAHDLCGLGSFDYSSQTWNDDPSQVLLFKKNTVQSSIFQFGLKETFTQKYKAEITQAPNITTYLNANVIGLEIDRETQKISHIRVATLSGNLFYVAARIFVLATGALENARILLMSNKTQQNGLGNRHDVVGRYFMDHFMVYGGILVPKNTKIFNHVKFYDLHWVKGIPIMGKLSLASEVRAKEQVLNSATYLLPCHSTYLLRVKSLKSCGIIASAFSRGNIPQNTLGHMWNVVAGTKHLVNALHRKVAVKKPFYFSSIRTGGWSQYPNKDREFAFFEIQHLVEQAPNPANRVLLSNEQDRLGCPKLKIDFQLRDLDIRSIKRTQELLKDNFAESEIGAYQIEREGEVPCFLNRVTGSSHHMGTTRMSNNPKQGVVDLNCKVHDIANLFIAGSSVFPTGSYANPTLTIIAMTIRLADHIKQIFAKSKL